LVAIPITWAFAIVAAHAIIVAPATDLNVVIAIPPIFEESNEIDLSEVPVPYQSDLISAPNKVEDHRVRVRVNFGANVVESRMNTGFRGYLRI
jgi:hypothetical protein